MGDSVGAAGSLVGAAGEGGTAGSLVGAVGESGAAGADGIAGGSEGGDGGSAPLGPPFSLNQIDDMADCDHLIINAEGRDGHWFSYNSGCELGQSGTQFPPAETCEGQLAPAFEMTPSGDDCVARTHGSGFSGGFAGIGIMLKTGPSTFQACQYEGVRFVLSGDRVRFQVVISDTVLERDYHGVDVHTSGVAEVAWDELAQEGWGTAQPFDCNGLVELRFQALDPDSFDFAIDEVELFPCLAGQRCP